MGPFFPMRRHARIVRGGKTLARSVPLSRNGIISMQLDESCLMSCLPRLMSVVIRYIMSTAHIRRREICQ
jgi:hypothetical protein